MSKDYVVVEIEYDEQKNVTDVLEISNFYETKEEARKVLDAIIQKEIAEIYKKYAIQENEYEGMSQYEKIKAWNSL